MSRILEALQYLERNERAEDRSVIPISEGIEQLSETRPTTSETAVSSTYQPESLPHDVVHRFDLGHDESAAIGTPHFAEHESDMGLSPATRDLEQRLIQIWEEYRGAVPSALVEAWAMSAIWKAAATSQPGWISGQFFDSGLPAECALAVTLDVLEKLEQPLLVIDGESSAQLSRNLGITSGPDLIDVILGRATPEDSVIPLTDNGLNFLPNRQCHDANLLPNWADVHSLFQSVRDAFGFTLVFCSMTHDPLSLRILAQCDDFWLWCRAGHTSVREVKRLQKEAERFQRQMAGAILVTM